MANLAIIPARGGSKRIPRKNIKDFLGKPIIAYSIEAAIKSELFDEIMVSTDDEEIAEVAIKYGANVPFLRSPINSTDQSTTLDVLLEVMDVYAQLKNLKFDYSCCLYATAPLIKPYHLNKGFKLLKNSDFTTIFPVVKFAYPIWRSIRIDENNKAQMLWPEFSNTRTQDLSEAYHDAGQWYWFKPELIKNSLISENAGSIILSESEVQDIDNLSDWNIAELKYSVFNE
jgi:N-acylneuraminate cytidylyltransferase